jgi:hypothetical protein
MATSKNNWIAIFVLCMEPFCAAACGEDVIIDVNTLPCGTARGNIASGNFYMDGELIKENCSEADFPGPLFVFIPGNETVVVNHYEPGVPGCATGRLEILSTSQTSGVPPYTLTGGIWSDGSFRAGQAVLVMGYTYRILMDGKYSHLEEGDPVPDRFDAVARVDVSTRDAECTYRVRLTGARIDD